MFKRWLLASLALPTLALVLGCGQAGTGPAATPVTAGHPLALAGHAHRTSGFDLLRYQRVQAPQAHLQHLPHRQGSRPASVDLRVQASPVVDQGDLGSCTAFAVGKGLREGLQGARHEQRQALSALFLYYEARKARGTQDQDSGATVTDAMQALAHAGIASESLWPYNPALYAHAPSHAATASAGANRLPGVQLAGLDDIQTALASGQPVALGMRLYNTFDQTGPDGLMPLPLPGDVLVGGHAVCVVGYDDARQVLIVKNSFGAAWGDHGYFYMPYAFVTPDNVMDIWTAR